MAGLFSLVDHQPYEHLSLEEQLVTIAHEGLTANIIGMFRDIIPNFSNRLKELKAKLSASQVQVQQLEATFTKVEKEALAVAEHSDFLVYGERFIMTPENFKGNLLEYSKVLNTVSSKLFQAQSAALDEYATILSVFLTNKDAKVSIKDHTAFFEKIESERVKLTKEISNFFTVETGVGQLPLRKVFNRFAEIKPFFEETKKLSDHQKSLELRKVQESVTHCVELLDLVIKGVKENTITEISPEAAKNIANGAYEMGKFVELVTVVYFHICTLVAVTNELAKELATQK